MAFFITFGSFCYQMAEDTPPSQCEFSCECADSNCQKYRLRIDHQMGVSAFITRDGSAPVQFLADGINQERIYLLKNENEELRVRQELVGNKIKAARYRTAKSEIYCTDSH